MTFEVVAYIFWGACAVVVFRPIFRGLMGNYRHADWVDAMEGLVMAIVVAASTGPVAIAFFVVRRIAAPHDPKAFVRRVGGESSEQRTKRLERERKERERYIESLERELGIGGPA